MKSDPRLQVAKPNTKVMAECAKRNCRMCYSLKCACSCHTRKRAA